MDYADDLDRFIEGQIGFKEIQSFRLQQKISLALQHASYYSEREHDLYEKLCYAAVLRHMKLDNGEELCAIYLFAKNGCFPHKLDWDGCWKRSKWNQGWMPWIYSMGRTCMKSVSEMEVIIAIYSIYSQVIIIIIRIETVGSRTNN